MNNSVLCFLFAVSLSRVVAVIFLERCYPEIGCFNNDPPFTNAMYLIPQSPDQIQTKFLSYTRDNTETEQILSLFDSTTITDSFYDGTKPTFFIIHGYRGNAKLDMFLKMKNALLQKYDCNVISVDWSRGAESFLPAQVAANTRVVGAITGKLMENLVSVGWTIYGRITLIGFSFGAHVAGYAGAYSNGEVGRIFGLDPAGPYFEDEDIQVRLDPTDAVYVEAIHTNAGGFGISQPVGDADFYPNGGSRQPKCSLRAEILRRCSHNRSVSLFTESITSRCVFTASPCTDLTDIRADRCPKCTSGCADMGLNGKTKSNGTFYLKTSNRQRKQCKKLEKKIAQCYSRSQ